MGYLHIENLYKSQDVLIFKEVYALEKVHGTSAHISYKDGKIHFFPGGEKYENFKSLFDESVLLNKFEELGHSEIVVFGEAYGGKQQGMSATYGKNLQFIAFDVKVKDAWLNVPSADSVASKLGLEFVPYELVPATIEELNRMRDLPSRVAVRRGIAEPKVPEGIVIRPVIEFRLPNGNRLIAKHKTESFSERKSKKDTNVSPEKLVILTEAKEIAEEWVTPMRLEHVLDKLPQGLEITDTPIVIRAMQEDIQREAEGEIVMNKQTLTEIGRITAALFKRKIKSL